MSTTNFSASLTTARKRQLTIYGWTLNNNYPVDPISLFPFQREAFGQKGNGPTAENYQAAVQGAILTGQPNVNVFPNEMARCPLSCAGVTLQGFVRNTPASSAPFNGGQST
jgi:hypothetical protein